MIAVKKKRTLDIECFLCVFMMCHILGEKTMKIPLTDISHDRLSDLDNIFFELNNV
jgi:hypothetical protein